jgi:hypothetical protein
LVRRPGDTEWQIEGSRCITIVNSLCACGWGIQSCAFQSGPAGALHAKAQAAYAQGIAPGALQAANGQARLESITVGELAAFYIARHAKMKKRSWRQDERMLRKDVLPRGGRRKACEIERIEIIALLNSIADRGAPI